MDDIGLVSSFTAVPQPRLRVLIYVCYIVSYMQQGNCLDLFCPDWPLLRWGFAYGIGDRPNAFIGDAVFGLSRWESHYGFSSNWQVRRLPNFFDPDTCVSALNSFQ